MTELITLLHIEDFSDILQFIHIASFILYV